LYRSESWGEWGPENPEKVPAGPITFGVDMELLYLSYESSWVKNSGWVILIFDAPHQID
jgi:hypothetical protein